MAAALAFVDRDVAVDMASFDEASTRRELAAFARRSREELIASGRASRQYETIVNGRVGASEDTVQLPGPIIYQFSNWRAVILAAIEELERRVPRRTGRYAASFVVLVNQRSVASYDDIPAGAEVIVFNSRPYTRKMEAGALGVGARHFDLTKVALNRRFGDVFQVQTSFLNIASGVAPEVPYILKTSVGRRKGRQAGAALTYPALVINAG